MHHFHFDGHRHRLFQRLAGFLTPADAEEIHAQVTGACARVRTDGGSLSVLVDMRNYPPQSQAVNEIGTRIAAAIAATPRTGYAVVTESALQRLRLRRVLDAVGPAFFEQPADAAAHLGWEPGWLATISLPEIPPAAAPPRAEPR